MPKKQEIPDKYLFLIYDETQEEDLEIAEQFAAFLEYKNSKVTVKKALAGDDKETIRKRLFDSDIVVPVVSSDFMRSDSAMNMLEEAVKSKKSILPLFFRECLWDDVPALKSLESNLMPKDMSLNEYEDKDKEGALVKIARKIKSILFAELPEVNENIEDVEFPAVKTPVDRTYVLLFLLVALIGIAGGIAAYFEWVLRTIEIEGTTIRLHEYGIAYFATYGIIFGVVLGIIFYKMFPDKFSKQ